MRDIENKAKAELIRKGVLLSRTRARILGMIMDAPFPPSSRDLGAACGIALNAVATHLRGLRRKGLVRCDARRARTVVPLVEFVPAEDL